MKTQKALLKLDTKKRIRRYNELLLEGFVVVLRKERLCGDVVLLKRTF